MINTTYTTSDGQQFTDRETAEAHDALVLKIDAWVEKRYGGDTARHSKREMLLVWTRHHENTVTGKTEHSKPE